jgi:hypothetical protein
VLCLFIKAQFGRRQCQWSCLDLPSKSQVLPLIALAWAKNSYADSLVLLYIAAIIGGMPARLSRPASI